MFNNLFSLQVFGGAGRARRLPWVRKYGDPSVRETLVLVSVRPYVRPHLHVYQGETLGAKPRFLAGTSFKLFIPRAN